MSKGAEGDLNTWWVTGHGPLCSVPYHAQPAEPAFPGAVCLFKQTQASAVFLGCSEAVGKLLP